MSRQAKFCSKGHPKLVGEDCPLCNAEAVRARAQKRSRKQAKKTHDACTRTWIRQARQVLKDFLACWHISSEGRWLPKEKLPQLHDIRERAELLAGTRIMYAYKLKEKEPD